MAGRVEREIASSRELAPEVALVLNVHRTAEFLASWTDRVLEPAGLRADEYNVLRILRGAGEQGHPRAEVERRMVHGRERLPALLHRLRSRGLIEGTLRLAITRAGLDVLASVDERLEEAIRAHVGRIPPDRVRAAVEVLEALREEG